MTDNNENIIQDKKIESQKNNNISNKKLELFVLKGKEFLKSKKSISMKQIFNDNKKLNLNVYGVKSNKSMQEIKEEKEFDNKSFQKPKSIEGESKQVKKDNYIENKKSSRKIMNLLDNSYAEQNKSNIIKEERSREAESPSKLDRLQIRKIKIDSSEKQDQFIEFYINNNRKNKIYNFKDNTITTTKYNLFTFIPKGLLYQFSRMSNVYFLFTAIIQSIPIISPLTSLTAIIPLIFVLGVSMIREAIEDLSRGKYDDLNNKEEVIVFRNNKFIKSVSKTLKHGEIVLVYENHNIPADMILIDTGYGEGTCYVETSSLDGEKNLKLKVANKYTQGFISNDFQTSKDIENLLQPDKYSFKGFVKVNLPNSNLNYVNGNINIFFSKKNIKIKEKIYLSINEFLLKGSILRNTNWIIGIVTYAGMSNKIILNAKKPKLKMSKVEKRLNLYLCFVFAFLMACCAICSIFHHFHYKSHKKFYDNYIFILNSANTESFIVFFTYFLLLNTLIPISLIVSTEIIKVIQGIFIGWDILLYSKVRHCFCSAKSISIIEELGNINFIFSDKTGTLTKNQLQFKYCIIDNKYYEYVKLGGFINKTNREKKKIITYEMIKKQNELKYKKNSFLSENNKLLLNNIINHNKDIYKNHLNISSDNINMVLTYKKIKNNINKNGNNLTEDYNIVPQNSKTSKNKYNKYKSNDSLSNKLKEHSNNSIYHSSVRVQTVTNNNGNSLNNSISENINSDKSKNNLNISENQKNKNSNKNSTILESNSEDSNNNSITNELIRISDEYFSDAQNNPYLNNILYTTYQDNSLNYIHEFWIALTLANECVIKSDNKGEIKYMCTSPDDLELINAASLQGYKLIETSKDKKTIRILGKDISFEVLKVLNFSSERKRMSIIVRDKTTDEIKLYTKGADCEIGKRLSKRSLENENYKKISDGLIEFSKRGLRTLMVAYRKINKEDYDSWINSLYENEMNIQNKERFIEMFYDIIENNLTLIGGTVVEDKLQDNVPETIKEFRSAGIKIWVLTGDKLDTAKNIGYSCNLLSKEQKLFTLKSFSGDEKVNEFSEIIQFFSEFEEFIEELVNKYNLESKFECKCIKKNIRSNNPNNSEFMSENESQDIENNSNMSKGSSNTSDVINFEMFKCLRDKNILEPFSIIIESPILAELFKDEDLTNNFLRIAYYSNTVICCRISPSQKSEVIVKMKEFRNDDVTLAIGDGGNDVSMIMEANIGIGIHGEEGLSAAQASDFAIGEFQLLKRLLFIHGRINLYRISEMILYFFFKNFIFTMTQFYFSFICLASGQTIIDDWYITCYNLVFTALPLCVRAITDSDIDLNDKKNIKRNLALLYKENRDKYKIFTFGKLIWKLSKGMIISLFIFIFCCVNEILIKGYNKNIWYLSLKSYICILIVVSSNLLINSHYIVYFLPLTIIITTFIFFIAFMFINHYGILFNFNSKGSIINSLSSPLTFLNIIFICGFHFIIDYTGMLLNLFLCHSLSNKLILKKLSHKKKKPPYKEKITSSKSIYRFNQKKRNSINFDECSNNYLCQKSFNKKSNNYMDYLNHMSNGFKN